MDEIKSEVFSVSFKPSETKEIKEFLDGVKDMIGTKPSRNDIVRRATLAYVRFMRSNQKVSYLKLFKEID